MVSFENNKIHVGQPAFEIADQNPKNTVYNIKRLLGHKFNHMSI